MNSVPIVVDHLSRDGGQVHRLEFEVRGKFVETNRVEQCLQRLLETFVFLGHASDQLLRVAGCVTPRFLQLQIDDRNGRFHVMRPLAQKVKSPLVAQLLLGEFGAQAPVHSRPRVGVQLLLQRRRRFQHAHFINRPAVDDVAQPVKKRRLAAVIVKEKHGQADEAEHDNVHDVGKLQRPAVQHEVQLHDYRGEKAERGVCDNVRPAIAQKRPPRIVVHAHHLLHVPGNPASEARRQTLQHYKFSL